MDTSENEEDISSYVNCIITFVINCASTKLPLKEKDMCNAINIKGRLFNRAFQQAKTALEQTYGICLADIPDLKTGKAYICYSEDTAKTNLLYDTEQQRQITLLFVILSYLFMRNSDTSHHSNNTSEEDLVNFLSGLRIHFDEAHEFFGSNVKKLVTETFIKQLYLKKEKVVAEIEGETKFYYSWGFRAHVEFDKKLILVATAKILKKPPSFFVAKYQEVCENDDNQMET